MNSVVQKFLTLLSISSLILLSIKLSKRKLSISLEEKEEGYIIYKDLGVKFKLSYIWREYANNLVIEDLGDFQDDNKFIYGGKKYSFICDRIIIDLFSIIVFREKKLTPEIKLPTITNMNYNKNISSISGYSFYFCKNEFNDIQLQEKEKIIYRSMYKDIENILKSLKTYKPLIEKPPYSL